MKKETNHEEIITKEQNVDAEKPLNKKIGVLRIAQVGLVVLLIILSANLFLSSKNLKAAASNETAETANPEETDENLQYAENEQDAGKEEDPLAQIGVEYYLENYGEGVDPSEVRGVVENFGCHFEIHVYKNEELVMRAVYFNGQVYEL